MVAALSAAVPARSSDRLLAAVDAVLVVGGARRRHRAQTSSRLPLTIVLFFIGAFVMRGAGCTWNDITDRDLDAKVERTRSRPIPSGQVSVTQALAFLVAQALIGLVVLLQFNRFAIADRHRLAADRRDLSVHEAHHLVAADRARPRLLLGRADGICRRRSAASMRPRWCSMPARSPG